MTDIAFVLSKLLWLVLRPGTFALLLIALGLALLRRRPRPAGRRLILAGLGFYLALLLLPLNQWVQMPLEDRFPRPAEPAHIDGIIVLGGAVEQDLTEARGIPALNGAAERMTEPVALLRRHPEAKLVFTGGQGALIHGGLTEADVARRLWLSLGVPADRMLFETESRNTHENAILTYRLVDPRPGQTWLLVTSASHMPRSVGVFRKAGWQVVPWPVNYRTGHTLASWFDGSLPVRLQEFEWGIREWVGLVAYWLMGRTSALFPAP